VPTEFQARAGGMQVNAVVRALELSAERVAEIGYDAFMAGQRVVIAGIGNRLVVSLMRLVPHALLLRLADQRPREARAGQ
jgi:short-subunit dehydrogenase